MMKFYSIVGVSLGLLVALLVWWSYSSTFFSVEFGLAELSPRGSEGGYAMPASGASTPTGLRYTCSTTGDSVTLQWTSSVYQGSIESQSDTKLGALIKEPFSIPVAYAGGGDGGGNQYGGGGSGSGHGHPVPAPVVYNIYLDGVLHRTNHTGNSYQMSISPDTSYSWGVQACSGGGCSSIQNSSFSCPGLPTLNFTADQYSVPYDSSTTLRWTSVNTNSCTASGAWSGSKATSGSEATGNLRKQTSYFLQCAGPRGDTQPKVATINIIHGVGADISACKNFVYKNEEFCLNYNVGTSAPEHCVIKAGNNTISGPLSQSSGTIDWSITGETTFTLDCEEGGNTDSATVRVLPEFQET